MFQVTYNIRPYPPGIARSSAQARLHTLDDEHQPMLQSWYLSTCSESKLVTHPHMHTLRKALTMLCTSVVNGIAGSSISKLITVILARQCRHAAGLKGVVECIQFMS